MTTKAELLSALNVFILSDAGATDDQKYMLLDGAYRYYYGKVVEQDKDFYLAEQTITTVNGTRLYTPSTAFARIAMMEDATDANSSTNPKFLPYLSGGPGKELNFARTGAPQAWQFRADQIRIIPIPDAAYSITMTYIPKLTKLSDSVDAAELVEPFDEWFMPIVYRAAKMFRGRNTEEWTQLEKLEAEEANAMMMEITQRQVQVAEAIDQWGLIESDEDSI